MTAWNTQAIGWCKRADVENVLLPAWSRLNSRERQVSLWCFDYWLWKFLPFSSRTSRLCSSQSLIIFSLPIVMCSLSLPWIPLCIRLLPTFLPSHCLFLFPYYCKEEEKIREGENANTGLWFFLLIDQASLYLPPLCILAQDDLLSVSLSCLSPSHYEVFYLQWTPLCSQAGETVRTARWPKRNLWLQGTRFALQMKLDRIRGIGIGGIIFMTVVRRCSISLL